MQKRKLNLDEYDKDIGIENLSGIMFGQVFYLNYYGINVFLYVCGQDSNRVRVFELAKSKIKNQEGELVEVIKPGLKPAKNPLIVTGRNGWTVSNFWLETGIDKETGIKVLYVPIRMYDPIYKKALELGVEYPDFGEIKAEYVKEPERYYWEMPKYNFCKEKKNYA